MITAAFHRNGGEAILAACDSELVGRVLREGDITIDTGSAFFKGDEVTEDEFRTMLAQATSANIVGRRAVGIAIEEKCVHPEACIELEGVPFAMFFCMG